MVKIVVKNNIDIWINPEFISSIECIYEVDQDRLRIAKQKIVADINAEEFQKNCKLEKDPYFSAVSSNLSESMVSFDWKEIEVSNRLSDYIKEHKEMQTPKYKVVMSNGVVYETFNNVVDLV